MGNMLDLLLNCDEDKVKRPRKEMEIGRLSTIFGERFTLICEALSPDKFEQIQENSLKIKGKDIDLDINQMQIFTVVEGIVGEDNKPLFKSSALQKKFKTPTPVELVKKLLLPGEISQLYGVISELSGFGDKAVNEIKN